MPYFSTTIFSRFGMSQNEYSDLANTTSKTLSTSGLIDAPPPIEQSSDQKNSESFERPNEDLGVERSKATEFPDASSLRYSEAEGFLCRKAEESELKQEYTNAFRSIVHEKREYDYLVNRLNKSVSEVVASKNKHQNSLLEISKSTENILDEISKIERGAIVLRVSSTNHSECDLRSRGPPLPSQEEMFLRAYEAGQVKTSYPTFSKWQYYSQDSRSRGNRY
jgi:hypothetical protein